MTAYSGALVRSAHFAFRPPVPGIDPRHEHQVEDPDLFDPRPATPAAQGGDVWAPTDISSYTEMRAGDIYHWAGLQDPVPSNVHSEDSFTASTMRMLVNHARDLFRPEKYAPYKHASQGMHIQYVPGRAPQNAGQDVPDGMAYLVMGRNSYDRTNQPNEVYGGGDPANVGRYRLGTRIEDWGLYEYHTKQGQDGELRAYQGLEPAFPVDKPPVADAAPYTPNSSGTARWLLPSFQAPSLFSLPSETSVTDYTTATEQDPGASPFDDGGRM